MGPIRTNDNPNQGGGDFGPSQLAGMAPSGPDSGNPDGGAGIGGSPQSQGNALQAVVEQVRTMEQGILALAQQFPQAAPECRRAVDAIRSVLQRVVSSPAEQEPQAPDAMA